MQHAALCLSGSADVSVQLTPYAAYRDSGAKPRVWSSYEGLKLGTYGDYIASPQTSLSPSARQAAALRLPGGRPMVETDRGRALLVQ